jgi:antitoxin (DNA-binding transcriptional repressor) of toxin-antitoxin stability system
MKKMTASFFKKHCFTVMDQVQVKREAVVITKRGKPVAELEPAGMDHSNIYNFMAGKGAIAGDLISPSMADEECQVILGLGELPSS